MGWFVRGIQSRAMGLRYSHRALRVQGAADGAVERGDDVVAEVAAQSPGRCSGLRRAFLRRAQPCCVWPAVHRTPTGAIRHAQQSYSGAWHIAASVQRTTGSLHGCMRVHVRVGWVGIGLYVNV